uniref:Uncharacterized protein AlNc14C25G2515 n=1 Tax=Albugo laibachii Nc14 TaxID=890382 RepID=F0W6M7_9STRA|nr:hypothetical protein SS1G_13224 [Albugo laibachii Nc14]|eukprot:CCA16772.1 hypothetical protein SS1G_13224 [Albugo laibachii Nc14]
MVACGNEQSFGKNYTLTFAAVMDMTTGKVILALSEKWGAPARHADVPNAYVKNSTEPDLDIYLYVPQGMKVSEKELQRCGSQHKNQVVLRLQRTLNGLKQAGRLWVQLLHSELLRVGFVQCVTDSCLYYKGDHDGKTVVGVYVDDLLIKDLGIVSKFRRMRFTRSSEYGYRIDQEQIIDELLSKFGLQDAHHVMTPIGLDHDIDMREPDPILPTDGPVGLASLKHFQWIMGSLSWLARCTTGHCLCGAPSYASSPCSYGERVAIEQKNFQVFERN